uniref:Palmitoyltransferase n=1 Tax=Heterorhabditis bacteriophora TaxID=37862 RepID=A0A1I7XCM6_HETBA
MKEKTQCCGRYWCVGDPCGIVCAGITWLLMIYGQVVVVLILLYSYEDYALHTVLNFIVFEALSALACSNLGPPGTTLMLVGFLNIYYRVHIVINHVVILALTDLCYFYRGSDERSKSNSWRKNMQSVFGGPCSIRWLNPLIEPYISKPAFEYSV